MITKRFLKCFLQLRETDLSEKTHPKYSEHNKSHACNIIKNTKYKNCLFLGEMYLES